MPVINRENITFEVNGKKGSGYRAFPQGGSGPGVIVLHAWWGLTPFFKNLCDRLAEAGFTAFAPDLHQGKTAATVPEAEQLMAERDDEQMHAVVLASPGQVFPPAVAGTGRLGMIGFSMGADWALVLASEVPVEIGAGVLFYGANEVDFGKIKASFQGHYGEKDEWTELKWAHWLEEKMQAAGVATEFYIYPGAGHWFFEDDRPDAYDAAAAGLAWERTLKFLKQNLG